MTSGRETKAPTRREALCTWLGMGAAAPVLASGPGDDPRSVGFGISESVVTGDVNLNDARAAMLVWIRRITTDMNLVARLPANLFEPSERILERLRAGQVDTVAINVLEYRRMAQWLDTKSVFVAMQGAGLQYVLLTRPEGGAKKLEQLRGRRLMVLRGPNMCVAPAWLSNLLRPHEPGGMERFFGSVAFEAKPARVILPVFFGQADACLTTMRGFSTMSELNPQIARRLSPLSVSPDVVTTLYAFRKTYSGPNRELLREALLNLSRSAVGRQVLAMYQLDGLLEKDVSCLDSSLAILAEADRAAGRKPGAGVEAKGVVE